jgi:hypothetical protein
MEWWVWKIGGMGEWGDDCQSSRKKRQPKINPNTPTPHYPNLPSFQHSNIPLFQEFLKFAVFLGFSRDFT